VLQVKCRQGHTVSQKPDETQPEPIRNEINSDLATADDFEFEIRDQKAPFPE